MIDTLTCEEFAQHLGSPFQLHSLSGVPPEFLPLELTLVEATPYQPNLGESEPPQSAPSATNQPRGPFSIVFQGPLTIALPQRIYPLDHAQMGNLEIFLVPIARRADGMYYEAVFT